MRVTTRVGRRIDNKQIVEVIWENEGEAPGSRRVRIHHEGVRVEGTRPFQLEVEGEGVALFRNIADSYHKALAAVVCTGLTPAQIQALRETVPNLTLL